MLTVHSYHLQHRYRNDEFTNDNDPTRVSWEQSIITNH